MITVESILTIEKDDLQEAAKTLNQEDIAQLVEWLSEKADDLRYQSLLLLQCCSIEKDVAYPYWDVFCEKLGNSNSYQRSIGLMLIAENVRWDTRNRIATTIDDYLKLLKDEKPITVRQCIQALHKIVPYKPELNQKISEKLMEINLLEVKDTMRKSILIDILGVLILIRKDYSPSAIHNYISNALMGEILDKKTKKQIEALL